MTTQEIEKLERIAKGLKSLGTPFGDYLAEDLADLLRPHQSILSKVEIELLSHRNWIGAIKEYRARTGALLKDAKDIIEREGAKLFPEGIK